MEAVTPQLVTLGPAGTFSELAAQTLLKQHALNLPIALEPTLHDVMDAVRAGHWGLVPIENLTEGFVSPVVDALVKTSLTIVAEVRLPVEFKLVANHQQPQSLWAQFVAAEQCREAIQKLGLPVTHTSSNGDSLQQLLNAEHPAAALVPEHIHCPSELIAMAHEVADIRHNETRFVLLSATNAPSAEPFDNQKRWKSSVLLIDDNDHPGLLVDSLSIFARRAINLTSIVSRPSGGRFGSYHFFIDFDGHIEQPHVAEALAQLRKLNNLQWLGSYPAA